MKTNRFLLVAGVSLAVSFTFSCFPSGGRDCSSIPIDDSSSLSGGKGNDIASYNTVNIGGKMWMAENLDYAVEGSKCYNNDPANCEKYGRLYDWATAMALDASCNSSTCSSLVQEKHRGVCPSGWHIPSSADWDDLMKYVQTANGSTYPTYDKFTHKGADIAGGYLKATSGWDSCPKFYDCGVDTYGFAALPGGYGSKNKCGSYIFVSSGNFTRWWSSKDFIDNHNAYAWEIANGNSEYRGNKAGEWGFFRNDLLSVRCVKD